MVNLYSQHHGKTLCDENGDELSDDSSSTGSESDHGIDFLKEPWYGVKYVKDNFSPSLLEKMLNPRIPEGIKLSDPCLNTLFPNDLTVIPTSSGDLEVPTLVTNTDHIEAWNMKCTKFNIPTVIICDHIYTNDCEFVTSVEGRVFSHIWIRVIREYFREYVYMAAQAGLTFTIGFDVDSLEIYFKGYSDRIEEFVEICMNKLKEFDPVKAERIFKQKKNEWLKDRRNFEYEDPNEQLEVVIRDVLIQNNFTYPHMISVGEGLEFDRFVELSKQVMKNGKHLWFSIGNIENSTAIRISNKVLDIINTSALSVDDLPTQNMFKLDESREVHMLLPCENEDEENSAVIVYFQFGERKSDLDYMLNCMMYHMLEEPAYDQLRTKEQLGYLVYCNQWNYRNVLGGTFVIQSSKQPPEYLVKRILNFVEMGKQMCENLSDEDFTKAVNALLSYRKQPEINLATVKEKIHFEITSHQYNFNRLNDEIELLESMIKDSESIKSSKEALKRHFNQSFIVL